MEAIAIAKMYRDFARFYFSVRSNLTYLNIIACGAITIAYLPNLIAAPNAQGRLNDGFWLYVLGCLALIAFSTWASAISNLLTNSFLRYILMATEIEEKQLNISYTKYRNKSQAVTYEFVPDPHTQLEHLLSGDVWNVLNGCIAIYALFVLQIVSFVTTTKASPYIFSIDVIILYGLLYFIFFVTRQTPAASAERVKATTLSIILSKIKFWPAILAMIVTAAIHSPFVVTNLIGFHPWPAVEKQQKTSQLTTHRITQTVQKTRVKELAKPQSRTQINP